MDILIAVLVGAAAGLILGWNFLPQPKFMQEFMDGI